MQQKPPQSKKTDQSTISSSKRSVSGKKFERKDSSFQQAAAKQVLMGGQAGDGLWCYANEHNNNLAVIKETPLSLNQKFKQIDSNIESEIVDALEQQCGQIGIELEQQSVQNQNLRIEIAQLKQIIDQMTKKLDNANKEIENQRNARANAQSQCDTVRDLYNKSKREMGGVQQELEQMTIECNQWRQEFLALQRQHEELKINSQNRYDDQRERIEELEEEVEELKNRFQVRGQIERKLDDERMKQNNQQKLNQVGDTEKKLEKMGKLLEENMTLSERLAESDILRRRFMEKNQQQEKEIKILVDSKIEAEKQVIQLKKRVNDLQIMKSTNQKILEDKINKLSEQSELQVQQNEKLQQQLKKQSKQKQVIEPSYNSDEEYEDVQAKPQLFGI